MEKAGRLKMGKAQISNQQKKKVPPSNLFPILLFSSMDAVYTARVEDVLPEEIFFQTCIYTLLLLETIQQ